MKGSGLELTVSPHEMRGTAWHASLSENNLSGH